MRYLDDLLILIGCILIGACAYLVVGWPGVVGVAGALCLVVGVIIGAGQQRERQP